MKQSEKRKSSEEKLAQESGQRLSRILFEHPPQQHTWSYTNFIGKRNITKDIVRKYQQDHETSLYLIMKTISIDENKWIIKLCDILTNKKKTPHDLHIIDKGTWIWYYQEQWTEQEEDHERHDNENRYPILTVSSDYNKTYSGDGVTLEEV